LKVTETKLQGVLVLEPACFRDSRGLLMETFNQARMASLGLPTDFKQDNFSLSRASVVRGIHYQIGKPQGKLVRVVTGEALDVVVDLRRSSPTFGQHVSIELSGDAAKMVWIPEGFGHGFSVLSEHVALTYKVTDYYSGVSERTILWNDPALGIDWRVAAEDAVLSDKDRAGVRFDLAEVFD